MSDLNFEGNQKLFLNKAEISDYFGWSQRTTDQYKADMAMPYRKCRGVVRFFLPDVLAWYENFSVGKTDRKDEIT